MKTEAERKASKKESNAKYRAKMKYFYAVLERLEAERYAESRADLEYKAQEFFGKKPEELTKEERVEMQDLYDAIAAHNSDYDLTYKYYDSKN